MNKMGAARVSALMAGLALAGCGGGGGGGVASSPVPPAGYTKIADMTGNRTFQTAGVQYDATPTTGFSNGSVQAFGSGVTVAYTEATDTYRLTAPDSTTATFDPASAVPPNAATPNTRQWSKVNGNVRDNFFLTVPTVSGVPLSYTTLGSWQTVNTTNNQALVRLAVGGAPTLASDMPRTGSATYSAEIAGSAVRASTPYTLAPNSTATFSANFASNSVTTALMLAGTLTPNGTAVTNFGTFNGTGTISSSGPGFVGTLSGAAGVTGRFSGAFFGPKALEMAYDWYMAGGDFSAVGAVRGLKQ